jgi:succinate dehydrogenase / fumarate reductase cytochrome b subunit
MLLGESNYQIIKIFLETFLGKFILIGITWSFSFQMLSEVRHLIMDLGYGFELQTTKITGLLVIFGSIVLTILIYLIGRGLI